MSTTSTLATALGDLDEAAVLETVKTELADGVEPMAVLQALQAGMEIVGQRFEEEEYFLSELMFAADIFKRASGDLGAALESDAGSKLGTIVLGTAKNDIHDFGKDIVATVLRSNGLEVVDLGVNVEYEDFVAAVREHKPEFVGISCLLTTAFDGMKGTVAALDAAGLRDGLTILVGGGCLDESVAEFVGADRYCATAQEAVQVARAKLGVA